MTKLQAIRKFLDQISNTHVTIASTRLDANWGMDMSPYQKTPRIFIPISFDFNEEKDIEFRRDFVKRCKMARGFSNTTLSILHELGHWETRSIFDRFAYEAFDAHVNNQKEYMENPFERIATDWAICWLQVPHNRRLAKRFEKEYFGY